MVGDFGLGVFGLQSSGLQCQVWGCLWAGSLNLLSGTWRPESFRSAAGGNFLSQVLLNSRLSSLRKIETERESEKERARARGSESKREREQEGARESQREKERERERDIHPAVAILGSFNLSEFPLLGRLSVPQRPRLREHPDAVFAPVSGFPRLWSHWGSPDQA